MSRVCYCGSLWHQTDSGSVFMSAGDRCIRPAVPVRGPAAAVMHLHPAGSVQAAAAQHLQRAPTLLLHQRSQVPAAQEVRLTTVLSFLLFLLI